MEWDVCIECGKNCYDYPNYDFCSAECEYANPYIGQRRGAKIWDGKHWRRKKIEVKRDNDQS